MLKIKLNQAEYKYFCQSTFIGKKYHLLLASSKQENDYYILNVSEDQADEIRDLCGEKLQITGFDEKYQLTSQGKSWNP